MVLWRPTRKSRSPKNRDSMMVKGAQHMKKKSGSHEPARQLSDEEVKHLKGDKKLIDQLHMRIYEDGKIIYSKTPFDQAD